MGEVKVDTASSFDYDPVGAVTVRFFLWAKIDRLKGTGMVSGAGLRCRTTRRAHGAFRRANIAIVSTSKILK